MEYKDGITGSRFEVGGIDRIITPRQVSSDITEVLRLSSVTFRSRSNLIWSRISVPLTYSVRFNASCTCDLACQYSCPTPFE
jgi:hypothetical protein